MKKNKTLGFVLFLLSFVFLGNFSFPVETNAAEKLKFGAICNRDSDCISNDCENADDGKARCDCNDDNDCSNPLEGYQKYPEEKWQCIDDGPNDIDYCDGTIQGPMFPEGRKRQISNWDILTDANLGADEIKTLTTKPQLKITIPGLTFSDPKVVENAEGVYLSISSLAEFIKAAYRYGIAAAGIIAVVMIINAGFLWTRSAGSAEVITKQKETIEKAVIGLVIAVSSYSILYFINPNLTKFESLKVQYIKTEPIVVDAAGDPPSIGPVTPGVGSNGVPYFAQWKGPWAEKKPGDPEWPYGGATSECTTIHQRGCGPTSLAMVLAYYGENVNPLDTGRWALGCKGAWQAYATLPHFSKRWPNLKMEIMTKKNPEIVKTKILKLLSENKPLVYNCAPCKGFDASGAPAREYKGHYIVLTGIHPDSKNYQGVADEKIFLTVNDPGRNENSRIMTMTLSQVMNHFKVAIYVDKK